MPIWMWRFFDTLVIVVLFSKLSVTGPLNVCIQKSFETVPDCEISSHFRNRIFYVETRLSPHGPVTGRLLSTHAVLCRSEGPRGRKAARIRTQNTGREKAVSVCCF